MQLHFDWPVWLGIVTTIMQGIASGTIHLTNMIPERYIPAATAYAGFFATINSLVLTAVLGLHVPDLPKLAAYVGSMIVSPAYGGQGGLAPNYSGQRYTPLGAPLPYGREPALTNEQYRRILTCEMHEHDPGFARTRGSCDVERARILREPRQ